MARTSLSDVVGNLLKISNGDVETFTRATTDFARDVTYEAQLPAYPAPASNDSQTSTASPSPQPSASTS